MRLRATTLIAGILIAVILMTGACSAGFIVGRVLPTRAGSIADLPSLPQIITRPGSATPSAGGASGQSREELFAPFWQAWDLVHKEFVDQPVNDEELMRGAIRGMLESLGDQHTSYMDPRQYEMTNNQLEGQEYEGIGAWVDITGEFLSIISPMPNSPAEKAGLKPGDQVIAVNGEDMTGVDGELVRQRVIGPKGTKVTLTIRREGVAEPFDVEVSRASILVPTVESRMLENNIAYVRLYTFGDKTASDLHDELKGLMDRKPSGLILDLRYNGGGYLETGIDVASEFIGDGIIMYEEYGDGRRTTYEARPGGEATDIPLVVLINEGSASASEIVAGAIQDRDRGQLVGVTSYGKGSVQVFTPLVNDEGAVRVTIARWLTPNGKTINDIGLEPDVAVELTDQDAAAGRDTQLDKAVELLSQK